MRAAFVEPAVKPKRQNRKLTLRRDRNGYPAIEARSPRHRRLLPKLTDLLRLHPSQDRLPFEQRVVYRLVSGPPLKQGELTNVH